MPRKKNSRAVRPRSRTARRPGENQLSTEGLGPVALVKRFGEEMDRLLEDFGFRGGWFAPALKSAVGEGVWAPEVEVLERDGQFLVRADLPGLTRDDVKVELSDNAITIEGERRGGHDEKGNGYFRSERSYGKFYRRLPLPEGADAQKANAAFQNGVLEITLPAPARTGNKPRLLEIRVESRGKARGKAA